METCPVEAPIYCENVWVLARGWKLEKGQKTLFFVGAQSVPVSRGLFFVIRVFCAIVCFAKTCNETVYSKWTSLA